MIKASWESSSNVQDHCLVQNNTKPLRSCPRAHCCPCPFACSQLSTSRPRGGKLEAHSRTTRCCACSLPWSDAGKIVVNYAELGCRRRNVSFDGNFFIYFCYWCNIFDHRCSNILHMFKAILCCTFDGQEWTFAFLHQSVSVFQVSIQMTSRQHGNVQLEGKQRKCACRENDEKQMAANCGSYDAKCDNEGKANIIVPFHFFLAKPLLLGFPPKAWHHPFIVLRTTKAWYLLPTKRATEIDSAHANYTYSIGILRRIGNDWQALLVGHKGHNRESNKLQNCVIIGKICVLLSLT